MQSKDQERPQASDGRMPTIVERVPQVMPMGVSDSLSKFFFSGSCSDMKAREAALGCSQVPSSVQVFLYLELERRSTVYDIVEHPDYSDMAMKEEVLKEVLGVDSIHLVKTVSLSLNHEGKHLPVMITILDHNLSGVSRKGIAEDLGCSNNTIKRAKLNPPSNVFDVLEATGLEPGIVGPFVSFSHLCHVPLWYYAPGKVNDNELVELALSPTESLVVTKHDLEDLMDRYEEIAHRQIYRRIVEW